MMRLYQMKKWQYISLRKKDQPNHKIAGDLMLPVKVKWKKLTLHWNNTMSAHRILSLSKSAM